MAQILVVDDQLYFKDLLEDELAGEGHTLRAICDADSVTQDLDSSPSDVVLLDLFLDGTEGWQVLESIKAERPHLPVVILTAYDTFRDDPRLSKAEAYVLKSFDLSELKETIGNVLDNGRSQTL